VTERGATYSEALLVERAAYRRAVRAHALCCRVALRFSRRELSADPADWPDHWGVRRALSRLLRARDEAIADHEAAERRAHAIAEIWVSRLL